MEKNEYQIIQEWYELVKEGIITEAEFAIKKDALLGKVKEASSVNTTNEEKEVSENNWWTRNKSWVIILIVILILAYIIYV